MTFGLSYCKSILKLCLPSISFAVFQLMCLKPRSDVTICSTFSTKMLGFVIERNSRMAAFVKAVRDSAISVSASYMSSLESDDLKRDKICSSILSAAPVPVAP